MKKHKTKQKWRPLIVFIWIVFLVAVSIGCMSLQRANVYESAKTELTNQAETISGQFDSLVETNFKARGVFYERLISEVKAISFVLENYDDIGAANDFLEDIVSTTEIKNLWICDRDGNVVFNKGDAPDETPEPEYIAFLLDSRSYERLESDYDEEDQYGTVTYLLDNDNNGLYWGVKDQWLIYAKDVLPDTVKDVVQFFGWDQGLQDILIGRDGVVLAVSELDGSVLSFADPSAKGKPVEELNVKISGENTAADVNRLLEAFSHTNEITEIEVDSVRYFAARMDSGNDLFLVMFPVASVEEEVLIETLVLMVPLALITGIGVIYVFCLAAETSEQSKNGSKKKGGRLIPSGKLKVFTLLAVILMSVFSLYLETHLVYTRMFQYTSTTAENVMQKRSDMNKMLEVLLERVQLGNLEKARIARCGLQHAASGKVDRQYVTDLADRLDVISLFVFDKEGKVSVTNAPYDGYTIDMDSPFHTLLEGQDSVVRQMEQEGASQKVEQVAGVTMIDDNNRVEGAVLIDDGTFSMIPDELRHESVFQRVFLKDNTVVMAVDSENKTVRFFAQMDGSFLMSDTLSYDYTKSNVADLGINENLIRDQFNGEMFAIDNQYFASVRRNDNDFLMVLRPLVFLDTGSLLSVIYVTGTTLLFFILLLLVTGRVKAPSEEDTVEADDQAAVRKKPDHPASDTEKDKTDDDVFTLLRKLANNEKYEFEERWPSDGKTWRQKTPMERFSTAVKLICIAVLAFIVVYAVIAGENSIFYYSLNGEWSSGMNLYSITSCIFTIILLILLKEIIHKVLYLIARAAKSRGETICCLLNSFTGWVLFIAGIFIILSIFGVNLAAMSLTAGVAGIIFGIGCQNIVADILAGIIMTFEGVAQVGDFVSYNGKFGVIQSIGVRTMKLKWFSEITLVRNNEFKNYINMPAFDIDRAVVSISIDYNESLTRVESVIERELPAISDTLRKKAGEDLKLKYRGVQSLEDSGIKLSFAIYCKGMYFGWARRMLNRELLLMCERNEILLALPQIVINERADLQKNSDS